MAWYHHLKPGDKLLCIKGNSYLNSNLQKGKEYSFVRIKTWNTEEFIVVEGIDGSHFFPHRFKLAGPSKTLVEYKIKELEDRFKQRKQIHA